MHILQLILLFFASFYLQASAQPYNTLVAPILKHHNTSLYTITLNSGEHFVLDINAPFSWFVCSRRRRYMPVACTSSQCIQPRTHLCTSTSPNDNLYRHGQCTCLVTPSNPVTKTCSLSQLTYRDHIIYWTNGKFPTIGINFNQLYISCANASLLNSFPKHAIGLASLSWSSLALSTQFTPPHIGVSRKFSICLPSARRTNGLIFFGDGPIYLPPLSYDITNTLTYTPLLRKNNSDEYYIGVEGISIGGKAIQFRARAFEFDALGHGGVKLSTTVPYTILRSDIYNVFYNHFSRVIRRYPKVDEVSPFQLCFNTSGLVSSQVGLPVPSINLEFGNSTFWRIFGSNSMRQVRNDVACLAFLDGGKNAEEAITIGAFQMENNLFLFDLAGSRLGFSSSLLFYGTACTNFNFTAAS